MDKDRRELIAFRCVAKKFRRSYELDEDDDVAAATEEVIKNTSIPIEEAESFVRTLAEDTHPSIRDGEIAFAFLTGKAELNDEFVSMYSNEIDEGISTVKEDTGISEEDATEFVRSIVVEGIVTNVFDKVVAKMRAESDE